MLCEALKRAEDEDAPSGIEESRDGFEYLIALPHGAVVVGDEKNLEDESKHDLGDYYDVEEGHVILCRVEFAASVRVRQSIVSNKTGDCENRQLGQFVSVQLFEFIGGL